MRWPVPELEREGVRLRLLKMRDEAEWIALRNRNREWLRPWEATAPPGGTTGALERLVAALRAIGSDLLAVVLTTPDVGRMGLHVARAIIPDFQPIHFGHAEARLGGRRLFELPQRLGLVDRVLGPADLNPDPHPLA